MLEKSLPQIDLDIIKAFRRNFSTLKSQPIVLYGIGEKTKLLIDVYDDEFNIVGLMDKNCESKVVMGKPLMGIEEVREKAKHIIIVSNYASVLLIFTRISQLEKKDGIKIHHLNGSRPNELLDNDNVGGEFVDDFADEEMVVKAIEKSQVVSFDLFDTLLMRKCLSPGDVFKRVEKRLNDQHEIRFDFTSMRVQAEKAVFRKHGGAYSIKNIYDNMQECYHLCPDVVDLCKNLELEVETESIVPRKSIVRLMRHAKDLRKTVVLTSDMYLPSSFMKTILAKFDITEFDELFISCEIGRTKYNGDLWNYYKKIFPNEKILHIGDNAFVDVAQAKAHNVEALRVVSAYEAFQFSSIRSLEEKALSVDDRFLLGAVVSELYNDPFVELSSRRVSVEAGFTLGYVFFGPLIVKFTQWLIKTVRDLELDKILFLARDGFILNKLYQHYCERFGHDDMPTNHYFYTSRRALSVASIRTEKDIVDACKLAPYVTKITFAQFFYATFGLRIEKEDIWAESFLYDTNIDDIIDHVLSNYRKLIFDNAESERQNYQNYYDSLITDRDERVGVVNFVSGGISQHFFEKLFPNANTIFLYFMTRIDFRDVSTLNPSYSLYGKDYSAYTSCGNSLIKHFLTAESVFSAPDEQFVCFSEDCTPQFEENGGNKYKDFKIITEIHDGIKSLFSEMMDGDDHFLDREYNLDLVDEMFGRLYWPNQCVITNEIRRMFHIFDNFSPNQTVETVVEGMR